MGKRSVCRDYDKKLPWGRGGIVSGSFHLVLDYRGLVLTDVTSMLMWLKFAS